MPSSPITCARSSSSSLVSRIRLLASPPELRPEDRFSPFRCASGGGGGLKPTRRIYCLQAPGRCFVKKIEMDILTRSLRKASLFVAKMSTFWVKVHPVGTSSGVTLCRPHLHFSIYLRFCLCGHGHLDDIAHIIRRQIANVNTGLDQLICPDLKQHTKCNILRETWQLANCSRVVHQEFGATGVDQSQRAVFADDHCQITTFRFRVRLLTGCALRSCWHFARRRRSPRFRQARTRSESSRTIGQ